MKPFRSEFVLLRDRRYHLRIWDNEAGDNTPTLFFLHGWGDVGASFQFIVDALQKNWRIIAPDWRGFGLSQWNEGSYWFPDYVADLDALLEMFSPDQAAQLVGHSMGGIVASLYAGIRPERVSHLATLEGFALWVCPPSEAPARFDTWLRQVRAKASAFRHYTGQDEFAARMLKDNPRLRPERAAFIAQHSLRESEGGWVFAADPHHRWATPTLYPLEEAKACWRQISARTLWIGGRESAAMKSFAENPNDYQERMACFAQVQEVIIDHSGHNLHHDQPEALAGLFDDFFSYPPV